jgi:ribosome-binding factor A
MNEIKDKRSEEIVKEMAMNFLAVQSNRTSLITVTRVDMYNRGKNVNIYFTVLPEDKEKVALEFVKRQRAEFREYMKKNGRLPIIPFVDFDIDFGERNRQNIDRLI